MAFLSRFIAWLYRNTLRSVVFGIVLMVLVAAYFAVGSGFAAVREYFEMNELQFFNAWPLRVLMLLLVANLSVVTWTRIPLTPPRYGVWCIHCGIITLILGTSIYYYRKLEGTTLIPIGKQAGWFYDNTERALFVRVGDAWGMHRLPSLPRFKTHSAERGNDGILRAADLQNIDRFETIDDAGDGMVNRSLGQMLESDRDVRVDVLGYYPYANASTSFVEDPSANGVAIRLRMMDVKLDRFFDLWLAAGDQRTSQMAFDNIELETRAAADAAEFDLYKQAAGKLSTKTHHLVISLRGKVVDDLYVGVGKTYRIGQTGYTISVEGFDPAFSMFGTGEIAKALILHVTRAAASQSSPASSPPLEFKRMVLSGKAIQTDFKLNVPDAGPMGKRQKAPIDNDLVVNYSYEPQDDPFGMLPDDAATVKHIFVTCGDKDLIDIQTFTDQRPTIVDMSNGGDISLNMAQHDVPVHINRLNHVRAFEKIDEVPAKLRTTSEGQSGLRQVVLARVSSGDWSKNIAVPFAQWPLDPVGEWTGPTISIPGCPLPLQMELGDTAIPLPALLTLNKFELVRYPGSIGDNGPMRDFKSTLTIEDPFTHQKDVEVAHMNSPVYFGDGNWLFFQHSWDAEGQRWSVIGVGTRPAVGVMLTGCVMIFSGLLYAFYAKPVVIRAMKQRAIRRAAEMKAGRLAVQTTAGDNGETVEAKGQLVEL